MNRQKFAGNLLARLCLSVEFWVFFNRSGDKGAERKGQDLFLETYEGNFVMS